MEKVRLENEELKDRLKAGAKEYSKLFEKYRLNKNKNQDLSVYSDLCGSEHLIKLNESMSTDSAIQEKSNQTRVSDFENTFLLDTLLNSSLNTQPQKTTSSVNVREQFGRENVFDDGLINRAGEVFENRQINTDVMIRACDLCDYVFPTGSSLQDVEKHYSEQHYGPSCPVCYLNFRKGYPQSDFEKHVNDHFNN